MENDIRRNGSGYVDPTAYKAIRNATKEEHKREVGKNQVVMLPSDCKYDVINDYNSKDIKVIIKEIEKG